MGEHSRNIYAKINIIGFKGDENLKSNQTLHDGKTGKYHFSLMSDYNLPHIFKGASNSRRMG